MQQENPENPEAQAELSKQISRSEDSLATFLQRMKLGKDLRGNKWRKRSGFLCGLYNRTIQLLAELVSLVGVVGIDPLRGHLCLWK